jgi:DNA-binding transcriptional LysR family regulator
MDALHSMGLFVDVVMAGSFSEAGRRRGLAASSVTRSISALEDELGVRLLNRTTRKLSLTEAGRLYHERSRRIIAEVEDARLSISQLEAAPRGTLRLNLPVVFGRMHVAPALPAFLARYPAVDIDMTVTDAFIDLVEDGVDLAVRIGELDDSSLIARRLAPNHRVICASPDYLARAGVPSSPQDLRQHNCLIYKRQPRRTFWRLRNVAGTIEIEVEGTLRANNADALVAAAQGGLGLTIVPVWMVIDEIKSGTLTRVLADYQVSPGALDTSIYAVFPYNRHLSPKVRALVDFFVEHFGQRNDWNAST